MRKFKLSKNERQGFLVVILLIAILFCLPLAFKLFMNQKDVEVIIRYLEDSQQSAEVTSKFENTDATKSTFDYEDRSKRVRGELFDFDPNTISSSEWQRLGLSEKQAEVILKYRDRGGLFRVKEDVRKMYVISDSFYDQIEGYINIDKNIPQNLQTASNQTASNQEPQKSIITKKPLELISIDLNSSDTTDLMQLRGIGSVFSERIIKYRDLLGGFYAVEQLKDVYGLSDESYQDIEKYLKVDASLITLIPINRVSESELSKHPYINYKDARIIVNYRTQHGGFENQADLQRIKGIDLLKVSRIFPYLVF